MDSSANSAHPLLICMYIYIYTYFLKPFFLKQQRKHTNHGFRFEDAKQKNKLVFFSFQFNMMLQRLSTYSACRSRNSRFPPNFFVVATHEARVDA